MTYSPNRGKTKKTVGGYNYKLIDLFKMDGKEN